MPHAFQDVLGKLAIFLVRYPQAPELVFLYEKPGFDEFVFSTIPTKSNKLRQF